MSGAHLAALDLPDFGMPGEQPRIPPATYAARVEEALRRAGDAGYDALVVYADREHAANLAYLTGFDPRFEEALLILLPGAEPTLLVGNECLGYSAAAPLPLRRVLYPNFSLMGQERDAGPPLDEVLADAGLQAGMHLGVVGWKLYRNGGVDDPTWLDAPAYLVDALRALAGDAGSVHNATGLFTDARDGLRVINEVDQLAAFEFAACHTSTAVRRVLFGLRPGMTEFEVVQCMGLTGQPQSCHLMLSSGERAWLGLESPTTRTIAHGDAFTTAYGVWGALNCRAGWVVADASELPAAIGDYVEKLVAPYFAGIAAWYEALRIGATGGELFGAVQQHVGTPFFGVTLNPGHQLHLDEWVNSPIAAGSAVPLRSGMALQADVIPATGGPYFTTNVEDGVALADESLREALAAAYPDAWARIQARRGFMAEVLGIRLQPEVLPFSNIPAYLPPFLLRPERAMTLRPGS